MGVPGILFTRQQIGELTGIDDATLNYWSREEIIRSTSGGAGRGSHRRFAYPEINIAAILNELRQFGIGLPALRGLANRFHGAMDWMRERGVTPENYDEIREMILERKLCLEEGYFSVDAKIHTERYPDVKMEQHPTRFGAEVHLTWDQLVEFYIRPRLEDDSATIDEALAVLEGLPDEEVFSFSSIDRYYYHAVRIEKRLYESSDPYYFYRDQDGDWIMSPNNWTAPVSIIAIDLARLNYNVWSALP